MNNNTKQKKKTRQKKFNFKYNLNKSIETFITNHCVRFYECLQFLTLI